LLQLHNGGVRQCCHAAIAYALLTFLAGQRPILRRKHPIALRFAANITTVAVKRGKA
jgi:hypothetical protein